MVINRNKDWKDKLTLFEIDSNNYPESVKLALLRSSQTIIHLTDNSLIKPQDKAPKIHSSEKVLMQALKVDSSCAGCYNNLSYLLLSYDNDPALALQYLYKGYQIDSTRKELLCNMGIAYMKLSRPDSAEKYLLKAVKSDRRHSFMVTYDVLESLYLKYDVIKGIHFFEKEIEKMPASEPMNVFLAKLYFANKDTANSLVYYKKALQIRPDDQNVRDFIEKIEKVYFGSKPKAHQ
jgi:tetratricopeptide (TPR) repeat protein